MSRTDPQFNLRIPEALRDQVMSAAKENGRSATAEILARLEVSFLSEARIQTLPPAAKARELSAAFRKNIPAEIKSRIVDEVNHAILHGLTTAEVNLQDMGLESLPEDDSESLVDSFNSMLSEAGYASEWDGLERLWIDFC